MKFQYLTSECPQGAHALFQLPDPPAALWIEGNVELLGRLPERGLGVVGTRLPQNRSRQEVRRVLAELACYSAQTSNPWVVLSGLARGIDAEAHQSALENGLPTVAILGCGLDQTYPPEHDPLRRRIVEQGGAIVSEFVPGSSPRKAHFVQRNRLIAAWSSGVWVVEAPGRSGALSTAAWAARLGRPVWATPAYPRDAAFEGNLNLLKTDRAFPMYRTQDLGAQWPEVLTEIKFPPSARQKLPPLGARESLRRLVSLIHQRTLTQGGASSESLLEASLAQGFSASEHFSLLQEAARDGWVHLTRGVWVSGSIDAGGLPPT